MFDRLSDWRIDSHCDVRAPTRWVRAIVDDGSYPSGMKLHARLQDGYETVTENVIDLPREGASIPASDYTLISFSLLNPSGQLLARTAGNVYGDSIVSAGSPRDGIVNDATGAANAVSWPPWPGGTPSRGIRIDKPWLSRTGLRAVRNQKQRERASAVTHGHGSEAVVTDRLREILRERIRDFVYVWDPYLDAKAILNVLQWADPAVPCRILCGCGMKPADLAALGRALHQLRGAPWPRNVECKRRIERRGGKDRPLYHDRFIITKPAAWMLGSSINSIGRAPGMIVRLYDPDPLRWMFDDEWVAVMPSSVQETAL